jgi:hypothetical protein
MKVYVVEEGDYEQRGVVLVAASVESAIRAIKARYTGYPVSWEADGMTLVGHFNHLVGKCCEHTANFDIVEYEVEEW